MNNYIVKTIFTKKECDKILEMDTSFVNRFYHVNSSFNKTWLNGILRQPEDNILDRVINAEDWVYDRLIENKDIGNYATCDGGLWPLLFKEYQVGDEIGMHFDDAFGVRRVAVSISLNDDYEGGVLQFPSWKLNMDTGKDNFKIVDVKLKVGQMVQFPLILLHRLTPITVGVRKQLLTWYTGESLNW